MLVGKIVDVVVFPPCVVWLMYEAKVLVFPVGSLPMGEKKFIWVFKLGDIIVYLL